MRKKLIEPRVRMVVCRGRHREHGLGLLFKREGVRVVGPEGGQPQEWRQRRRAGITSAVARKKLSTTVYLTVEQDQALKELSTKTKVPAAEYIRQGIDLILAKHREALSGQTELSL